MINTDVTEYATNLAWRWTILMVAVILGMVLLYLVGLSAMFRKAGKPGWAAFVPFYNGYVQAQIVFGNGFFFVLGLGTSIGSLLGSDSLETILSFVTLLYNIFLAIKTATAFDKGVGYTIGLIFLPFVFYPILGFGSSYYAGPYAGGSDFFATGSYNQTYDSDYYKNNDYRNNPSMAEMEFYSSGSAGSTFDGGYGQQGSQNVNPYGSSNWENGAAYTVGYNNTGNTGYSSDYYTSRPVNANVQYQGAGGYSNEQNTFVAQSNYAQNSDASDQQGFGTYGADSNTQNVNADYYNL